ncbi:ATP-binding protein [Clostridium sartagoforme]
MVANNEFMGNGLLDNKRDISEIILEGDFNFTKEELISIIAQLNGKSGRQENFLLNISHDLRGHLNVILSIMQCIDYGSLCINDKKVLEYMNMVKRNSLKMLKLINNLIDTTKLENNYYVLNKRNIDIISMVEGTISCIDKYAKQKDIQLIFDTNEEECIMSVDPEAIDRIIMNLISNAIKFSYSNTNVYINMLVIEDKIRISIKDEGPGISQEYQEKIFNRFYQVSKKDKKDGYGSGIGLDLVNYLVRSMNGEIELKSQLGNGSEFIITLPIEIGDEQDSLERDFCMRDNSGKIQMLEIEFSDIYNN